MIVNCMRTQQLRCQNVHINQTMCFKSLQFHIKSGVKNCKGLFEYSNIIRSLKKCRIEYEYPLFKVYYSNNSNYSNIRGNPEVHTSKPPLDQVWLFQPSVISRPPPHYREIMPNYRKVIFLLPPLVNIMTITWVLCRRAVRSNELIECSTAPPPPRPTVTTVISIGMGYGLNLKSICSKL